MHVFAISLADSVQRRAALTATCERYGLTPEILDATRGSELQQESIQRLVAPEAANVYSRGEIGCALSHLAVMDMIVQRGLPRALVLEDDAIFCRDPMPAIRAAEAVLNPEDSSVFILSPLKRYINKPCMNAENVNFFPCLNAVGAHAYIVTLAAARALARFARPVRVLNDMWKYFIRHKILTAYVTDTEFCNQTSWLLPQESTLNDRAEHLMGQRRHEYNRSVMHDAPWRIRLPYYLWRICIYPWLPVVDTHHDNESMEASMRRAMPLPSVPVYLVPAGATPAQAQKAQSARRQWAIAPVAVESHRAAWEKMLLSGQKLAFILEDTAVPDQYPERFFQGAAELAHGGGPDVFLMTHFKRYDYERRVEIGGISFYPADNAVGTEGYVLTAAAAKALLELDDALSGQGGEADLVRFPHWNCLVENGRVNLWVTRSSYLALQPNQQPTSKRIKIAEQASMSGSSIVDTMM